MSTSKSLFWEAFQSRDDLQKFGNDSLLLFALQLRFGVEDIDLVANNSLTEGTDDKKADLVYIDYEAGCAVIAQSYISQDISKTEAPANKASDLNTAASWLLSRPIGELPERLQTHAEELRQLITDGVVKSLHFWYVHNLPESNNVKNELITVENTAGSLIEAYFPGIEGIEIQALEVGITALEELYKSISTPILVSEEFTILISGGFEISGADWKAYVTSIPARWLYEQFHSYKTDLFSADVREYLGSRKSDANINNAIKETAHDDPTHFWVYNNGITALVYEFDELKKGDETYIHFKGFSIVNGAQTTGAIGSLNIPPDENAKVQVRFIMCSNINRLHNIVLYNNSQNKVSGPDFRSNDSVQTTLVEEFRVIPYVEYVPRRGGYEDVIRRQPNVLPSITAGQALAAFHADPGIAYHQKTRMWEEETLYHKYFNEQTTAKHILFAYSLLKTVERKKHELRNKSKSGSLTESENEQLDFFRKRGSTFLMASAVARCLEVFIGKPIPNPFSLDFRENISPEAACEIWTPIVEVGSSFAAPLVEGLSDGFKTHETVDDAIKTFRSFVEATKQGNAEVYSKFAEQVA